jgi:hypothetical protein
MKHIDAFVNDDVGYGWGDLKMLVTKKELIDSLKLTFICEQTDCVDKNICTDDISYINMTKKQIYDNDIVLSDTINHSIHTYNIDKKRWEIGTTSYGKQLVDHE